MDSHAKRSGRSGGVALAGILLAGLASGQAKPDGPSMSRFPTLPAEHAHARMLLDNAMRPLHGRSHDEMNVVRRRVRLPGRDQQQCAGHFVFQ